MQKVARLAGVSLSTVSRVINERPRVAATTVESVRRAMAEIQFIPTLRRRVMRPRMASAAQTATIAFLVLGTSGEQTAPGFEKLLRGVSDAAGEHSFNMIFSFVSDLEQLPPKIAQRRVDGLLLHGERPGPAVQAQLQTLPTVWLMANRQRPSWGDQVMPDNTLIGELAAQYLIGRGHRRLAFLSASSGSWAIEIRYLSFAKTARELGAQVDLVDSPVEGASDLWSGDGVADATRRLMERALALAPRPTGLFVAEDRLLPAVDAALKRHGLSSGPEGEAELISCNNERAHFAGLSAAPATIDIRVESIGRRGVEQLLWRMAHRNAPERIRAMVEPALVSPEFLANGMARG